MQQVYVKWCKWCAIRHCGIRRLRLAPLSFGGDEVDGLNGDVTDRCGQTLNLSWCLRPLGVAETPAPLSPRALQSSARRLAGLSSDSFSFGCLRHICTFEVVPTHSFRENNASGTRMSFVTLAGSTQDAPSFLELIAAHRLERGLRDAFSYALSVRGECGSCCLCASSVQGHRHQARTVSATLRDPERAAVPTRLQPACRLWQRTRHDKGWRCYNGIASCMQRRH